MSLRSVWVAAVVAMALLASALAGCGGDATPTIAGSRLEQDAGSVHLTITGPRGSVAIQAEVADTPEERARGLAGRTELADDAGMLFVNDRDVTTAYWMKDTLLPLSIAFADAGGVILEILDMDPCRANPCPSYAPSRAYRVALEVNRGAFARWRIDPGARIALPG